MSDDMRARVLRAMWVEMNGWVPGFAFAAHHLSKALLDGRLPERSLAEFPIGTYPDQLARAVAQTAGLEWCEDGPVYVDGLRVDVDTEEVDIAVSALRAIPAGSVCRNDDPDGVGEWQFYPETLTEKGLTIEAVREFWTGLTLREAAQLIVDVADVPNYGAEPDHA